MSKNTEEIICKSENTEEVHYSKEYYNTNNLKEIYIPEENKYFKVYDNALYSYDYKKLYVISLNSSYCLNIHKETEEILYKPILNTFKPIKIPASLQQLSSITGNFYDIEICGFNCHSLKKIVIKSGHRVVISLPDCTTLKEVYLPENIRGFYINCNFSKPDKDICFYGYEKFVRILDDNLLGENLKNAIVNRGYKFRSFGKAPDYTKDAEIIHNGEITEFKWEAVPSCDGYKIIYSPNLFGIYGIDDEKIIITITDPFQQSFITSQSYLNIKDNLYISP